MDIVPAPDEMDSPADEDRGPRSPSAATSPVEPMKSIAQLRKCSHDPVALCHALKRTRSTVGRNLPLEYVPALVRSLSVVVDSVAFAKGNHAVLAHTCRLLAAAGRAMHRECGMDGLRFYAGWMRVCELVDVASRRALDVLEKHSESLKDMRDVVGTQGFWEFAISGVAEEPCAQFVSLNVVTADGSDPEMPWWFAVAELASVLANVLTSSKQRRRAVGEVVSECSSEAVSSASTEGSRSRNESGQDEAIPTACARKSFEHPDGGLFLPIQDLIAAVGCLLVFLSEAKALEVLQVVDVEPVSRPAVAGERTWIDDLMRLMLHFFTRETRTSVRLKALEKVRSAIFGFPGLYDSAVVVDVLGHVMLYQGTEDVRVVREDLSLRADAIAKLSLSSEALDCLFENLEDASRGKRGGVAEALAAVEALRRVILTRLPLPPAHIPLRAVTLLQEKFAIPSMPCEVRREAAATLGMLSCRDDLCIVVHPAYRLANLPKSPRRSARFATVQGNQFERMTAAPIVSPYLHSRTPAWLSRPVSSVHADKDFSDFAQLDGRRLLSSLVALLKEESDVDVARTTLSAIMSVVVCVGYFDETTYADARSSLLSLLMSPDEPVSSVSTLRDHPGFAALLNFAYHTVCLLGSVWETPPLSVCCRSEKDLYSGLYAYLCMNSGNGGSSVADTLLQTVVQACDRAINRRDRPKTVVKVLETSESSSVDLSCAGVPDSIDFAAVEVLQCLYDLNASEKLGSQIVEIVSKGLSLGNAEIDLEVRGASPGRSRLGLRRAVFGGDVWQRWRELCQGLLIDVFHGFQRSLRVRRARKLPSGNHVAGAVVEYVLCSSTSGRHKQRVLPARAGDHNFVVTGGPLPHLVSVRLHADDVLVCQRRATGSSVFRVAIDAGLLSEWESENYGVQNMGPAGKVTPSPYLGKHASFDEMSSLTPCQRGVLGANAGDRESVFAAQESLVLEEIANRLCSEEEPLEGDEARSWHRKLQHREGLSESEALSVLSRLGPSLPTEIIPARSRALDDNLAHCLDSSFDHCSGVVSSFHEVGVMFCDEWDDSSDDLLGHHCGSDIYVRFLDGLGETDVAGSMFSASDVACSSEQDDENGADVTDDCSFTILHRTPSRAIEFKVATGYPHAVVQAALVDGTSLLHKIKADLLNCHVVIVWNESGRRFDPGLLRSSVVLVRIIIAPTAREDLFHVQVICTPEVDVKFGPLMPGVEGCLVPWTRLCQLVCATAVNADIASLALRNCHMGPISNFVCQSRLRATQDIVVMSQEASQEL